MRIATIDIGTNSVLLLVVDDASGEPVALAERATITRLGQGVDKTRALAPEAIERTLACLRGYAHVARDLGAERIVAAGTSAMRDARGGDDFRAEAARFLGEAPRVISGDDEARLTFAGSLVGTDVRGDVTVFDVGGGSTEVVVGTWSGREAIVADERSLDVGSVRLTERHAHHDPLDADDRAAIVDDVDRALAGLPFAARGTLVGVAGTVTTLAAHVLGVHPYDARKIHGARLDRSRFDRAADELAAMTVAERRAQAAIDEKRADVLGAGALLTSRVLAWAGADELVVSDRGVRWGVALEVLAGRL